MGCAKHCCIVAAALCFCASAQPALPGDRVVGTVDGAPIGETKLKLSPEALRRDFFYQHGRNPTTEADQRLMAEHQTDMSCLTLRGEVIRAAEDKEIRRRGIVVASEEANLDYQAKLRRAGWETAPAQFRAQAETILAGLKEVLDGGKSADDVYRSSIAATGMNQREWNWLCQEAAKNPASAYKYYQRLAATPDVIPPAPKGWERNVAVERVRKAVAEELAAQDPEFARLYYKREAGGPLSERQLRYIENKQIEWWQQRFREVELVIYDEELARACDASIKSLLGLPVPGETK